ncbi:MAG: patatin-like phospholipase family protein [Anaerolineae bacterium]|nr:patatin-like phospholipase family protein [Anaerolineae bacterium]
MAVTNGRSHKGCKKVGLALGGGAVRGFAHVGALAELEKANIPIHYVAGTSVGSIIGALYVAGVPLSIIRELSTQMNWGYFARPTLSREGFLSFERLEKWLIHMIGDLHFADLDIPFAVSTLDVETGEEVVINSGPIARAVRASCSVPGIVTPVWHHGRLLGDGGIVNNVPVSVVRQLGAEYVIAIDVFQESGKRRLLGPLNRGLEAIEILVRGNGWRNADCTVTPPLSGKTYVRFAHGEQIINLGAAAAAEKIPLIQADLGLESY